MTAGAAVADWLALSEGVVNGRGNATWLECGDADRAVDAAILDGLRAGRELADCSTQATRWVFRRKFGSIWCLISEFREESFWC